MYQQVGCHQPLRHIPPHQVPLGWVPPNHWVRDHPAAGSRTTRLGATKPLGHGPPNGWVRDHQVGCHQAIGSRTIKPLGQVECHQATAAHTTTSGTTGLGTTGLGTTKPLGQGPLNCWVTYHHIKYHWVCTTKPLGQGPLGWAPPSWVTAHRCLLLSPILPPAPQAKPPGPAGSQPRLHLILPRLWAGVSGACLIRAHLHTPAAPHKHPRIALSPSSGTCKDEATVGAP